jgi:prepilin-type processing-associated H-X9-DG protein
VTDANLKKGVFWPYVNAVKTYHCPSDTSKVNGHPDILRFRSYMSDQFLGAQFLPPGTAGYPFIPGTIFKESQVINAATIFEFIEPSDATCDLCAFGPYIDPPYAWGQEPTDRHSQGGDLSFLDGHVEYHRWLWPKRRPDDNGPLLPENAQDNQDLMWLLVRTPFWYGH